jgi:LmbE family N-acetylglucosaminyl deacetylase
LKELHPIKRMQSLDRIQLSSSTIVIVAPHMDDEALACGGLIALLPHKDRIHIIYATDGMKSPAPIIVGRDQVSPDLGKIRMQESTEAMKMLGVPGQNLHFLGFSDGELQKDRWALQSSIREKIKKILPQFIFVPFRYDRHADHLAVNHVVALDIQQGTIGAQLVEYFVYHRWRLMPKRDIRKYIKSPFLFQLDIARVAEQKRQALDCFVSQATNYYPWQTRPILTQSLLDGECQNPEYFLIAPAPLSGVAVFSSSTLWIWLAHRLEPILLRWKYLSASLVKRIFQNRVIESD